MAFDGSYPRKIRESGVVYRIYVRRARCTKCGIGDALLPEFILGHRLDSATTIGAAVLTWVGHPVPDGASHLYERVPERTVRSWRQRFAERAEDLTARLYALCVEWGGVLPVFAPTPLRRAVQAIGATWAAAQSTPLGERATGLALGQRDPRQPAALDPRGSAVADRASDDRTLTQPLNRVHSRRQPTG